MSLTISTLTRRAFPAVLVATSALNPVVAAAVPAGTGGGTVVGMGSIAARCDFSPIPGRAAQIVPQHRQSSAPPVARCPRKCTYPSPGAPGAHYDVSLIQAPRASNAPCVSPGPGVAVGALDSDGVGQATTTLQDSIRPGTTGAWVFIQRPSPLFTEPGRVLHVRLRRAGQPPAAVDRDQPVLAADSPIQLLVPQQVQ